MLVRTTAVLFNNQVQISIEHVLIGIQQPSRSVNYEVQFTPESGLSERVLFPVTPFQCNGIEDARFVLFHNEEGTQTYYATYAAYDGKMILPQFSKRPTFFVSNSSR